MPYYVFYVNTKKLGTQVIDFKTENDPTERRVILLLRNRFSSQI